MLISGMVKHYSTLLIAMASEDETFESLQNWSEKITLLNTQTIKWFIWNEVHFARRRTTMNEKVAVDLCIFHWKMKCNRLTNFTSRGLHSNNVMKQSIRITKKNEQSKIAKCNEVGKTKKKMGKKNYGQNVWTAPSDYYQRHYVQIPVPCDMLNCF